MNSPFVILSSSTRTAISGSISPRQYMRCSICAGDWGRRFAQNTVVDLSDGSTVNSLFDLHGVRSFQYEYERAKKIK